MEKRKSSPVLVVSAILMFLFLLAPVIVVIPISLNDAPYLAFPPERWSFRWYFEILKQDKMRSAFNLSLLLAVTVAFLCLLIGLPAAYALVRLRIKWAAALSQFFTAPLLLPSIVLALSLLIVIAPYGLLGTFTGLLLAHLVVTLPYAIRVLSTSLSTMPPFIEEAASTLGASPFKVFRRVTLPLLAPGLIGTVALCFLISFDEIVLSLFISGPRLSTLPVQMYHHVENQADPLIAAISVLLIFITLVVVLLVERSLGLAKTFVK